MGGSVGVPAGGGLDEDLLPHGGRRSQCVRRDPVHHPLPSGLDPRSGRQGEIPEIYISIRFFLENIVCVHRVVLLTTWCRLY